MRKNKGLYIHIPFCTHLCSYCDFTKMFFNEEMVDKYLSALEKELKSYDIKDITSIYIGGGTPTSLNDVEFRRLLDIVSPYYKEGMSYAVEGNIENLSSQKIKLLKEYKVNRVSLGVQSFDDELLKLINRHHTKDDTFRVIDELVKNDIKDINIDLIYALPNQDLEKLKSILANSKKIK